MKIMMAVQTKQNRNTDDRLRDYHRTVTETRQQRNCLAACGDYLKFTSQGQ